MLMFEVNDKEAEEIAEEFKTFDKQLELLDKIDTSNVQEMIYPFDIETTYLRKDEADHQISQDDVLNNAAKVKEGHIVVPKVVK